MKKTALLTIALLLCAALAGCGGAAPAAPAANDPAPVNAPAEPAPSAAPQAEPIIGTWECIDASITEAGVVTDGQELLDMLGMEYSELLTMSVRDDGSGELSFLGDDARIIWEGDAAKGYKLSLTDETGTESEDFATAEFKDGQLSFVVTDSYDSDGEEIVTEMYFLLENS